MSNNIDICENWYEKSYKDLGFKAQREYPNEELCRFIGRNYNNFSKDEIKNLTCLEIGCGSGSNLWMLKEKGFKTIGLDLSSRSLELAKERLISRNLNNDIELIKGSMTNLPFIEKSIDIIVDVFSSNCLTSEDFEKSLLEIARVLTKGGKYFLYTPSKSSDAFLNHSPSTLLDSSTLDGIKRKTSPFTANFYPFRFEHPEVLKGKLEDKDFTINYLEKVSRTYNNRQEFFEFLVIEASK